MPPLHSSRSEQFHGIAPRECAHHRHHFRPLPPVSCSRTAISYAYTGRVGLLIPVEHPVRVDIRRAARVCRELGASTISVESLRPRDRAERDYVISQLVPGADACVTFQRGTLSLDELAAVALTDDAPGMYTDVRLGNAAVRVWDDHAWVHVTKHLAGGLEAAKQMVAAAGIAPEEVVYNGKHLAIDVKTPNRAAAYEMFRAFADPQIVYGTVSNPGRKAIAHLPGLLAAVGGEISIEATLPNDVAATVTERVPCSAWQIDDLLYDPTSGLLSTYRVAPVTDAQIAEWHAKLDAALLRELGTLST